MLTTDLDKPGCSRNNSPPASSTAGQQHDHGRRWTGLNDALLRQLAAASAATDDLEQAVTEFANQHPGACRAKVAEMVVAV
jgi:hypothetical protein